MEVKNRKMKYVIPVLSIAGILVSLYLVVSDMKSPGFCPRIMSLPACYIVLIAFYLVLRSVFAKSNIARYILFFTGSITGLTLAVWFSYNQLRGLKECPETLGLPLCYVSFAVFLVLIVVKVVGSNSLKVKG